jgi:hypothetical protein
LGAVNQICSRQRHQISGPFLALEESQPLNAVSHPTLTDRASLTLQHPPADPKPGPATRLKPKSASMLTPNVTSQVSRRGWGSRRRSG